MLLNLVSNRKIARGIAVLSFLLAVCFLLANIYCLYDKIHESTTINIDDIEKIFKYVSKFLDALASAIFIILWWNRTKYEPKKKHVYLFLSLAWLVWAIPILPASQELQYFFSQVNNLFLLWALWDFSHGGVIEFEPQIRWVGITHKNFLVVTFVGLLLITVVEVLLLRSNIEELVNIGVGIDNIVSSFVVLWLCTATSLAFIRRFVGYSGWALAIITTLLMIAAIAYQFLYGHKLYRSISIVLSVFYQTGITLVISALTVSWAFFQMREKEKHAIIYAKKREDDMIHIIRNILRHIEIDLKKIGNIDYLRIGTARLLFEHIHLNKPSGIFEFLKGANLKKYLNSVLITLKEAFNWEGLEINIAEIPIEFAVWETSAQKLARIVVEAGINAYKYSGAKKANIRIALEGQVIVAEIHDFGPGFNASNKKKSKEFGMGYEIIDLYLKDLKGSKEIKSHENGSTVIFTIPIGKFLKHEGTTA